MPTWRRPGIARHLGALVAALGIGAVAHAACYSDLLGGDEPFAAGIELDPKNARSALDDALARAPAANGTGPSRAHLYVMRADALEAIGDIDAARLAVESGLRALQPTDDAVLRRRLQLTGSMLLEEQGHLDRALVEFGRIPDAPDAPDLACVLIYRGSLRFRAQDNVPAAEDFVHAYQIARDLHRAPVQLNAAQLLARLYAKYDLYADARELADEAIGFYLRTGSRPHLADAYFLRGDVELSQDDYRGAEADFLKARDILQIAGLPLEGVFAAQELCITASRMTDRADAAAICGDAYDRTRHTDDPEGLKMILGAFGEIAFRGGRLREAIDFWNRALAEDGVDFPAHQRWRIHRLRGQAYTRIGDVSAAARDDEFCLQSLEADQAGRNAARMALLQVKFETSLKDEALARSRAETRSAELATSRQALIRNAVIGSASLAVMMAFFGAWMWSRRKLAVDARLAAEERLASVGRLTGGIAHEFNNLLSALLQALWLLARRKSVSDDPMAVELVEHARTSSEICANITSQLLSFARQQNLAPEAVVLRAYLAGLRPMLERTIGAIALRIDIGASEPVAWVDPRQLTSALINLAINARDAIDGAGTLTVSASTADRRVRIDVADDGCGMAPEVLARAVEPFFTTKAVGHGSGLGLSMVDGFATQSGGALGIASRIGGGTTVTLWLPAAPDDLDDSGVAS